MNKNEKSKVMKLKERHDTLLKRLRAFDGKILNDLKGYEVRQLDQWYGECVGIEGALIALEIDFESVD